MPTVTRQITNKQWTGNKTIVTVQKGNVLNRTVRWMTPLRYHGEIIHVIEMEDTTLEGERLYYNRWITNVKPNEQNTFDLAQAGRLRWKIENEGINTQKTGGYEMEHAYGLKKNSWKNYYLALQISQLINDMVRFSDYIPRITENPQSSFLSMFGTIRNFAKKLIESFRNKLPRIEPLSMNKIQIRLRPLII